MRGVGFATRWRPVKEMREPRNEASEIKHANRWLQEAQGDHG